MTIKLEKEMNDMYNLSADIREDGRLETTIEFIKNIMFKNNLLPKKQWNYSALTKPNILAIWRCCKTDKKIYSCKYEICHLQINIAQLSKAVDANLRLLFYNFFLIPAKQIPCINLIFHIIKAIIISVSNNYPRIKLKFR